VVLIKYLGFSEAIIGFAVVTAGSDVAIGICSFFINPSGFVIFENGAFPKSGLENLECNFISIESSDDFLQFDIFASVNAETFANGVNTGILICSIVEVAVSTVLVIGNGFTSIVFGLPQGFLFGAVFAIL